MQALRTRQLLVAQAFLSSISLDGNSNQSAPTGSKNKRAYPANLSQSKRSTHTDVDTDDEGSEHNENWTSVVSPNKTTGSDSKSGPSQQLSTHLKVRASNESAPLKVVSFGELLQTNDGILEGRGQPSIDSLKSSIRQRFPIGTSPLHSHSCTTGLPTTDVEPPQMDSYSCRYTISTKNGKCNHPLVVASVIPLPREPLPLPGPKSGGSQQEQISLFNNLFRHTSRGVYMNVAHVAGAKLGDSDALTVATARPLSLLKILDTEERSYVHLLRRHSNRGRKPSKESRRIRRRTESDGNTSSDYYCSSGQATSSTCSSPIRPLSVSTSSLNTSLLVAENMKPISPLMQGETESAPITCNLRILSVGAGGQWQRGQTSSGSSNLEKNSIFQGRLAILYEDPLTHYNPTLLDDPLVPQLTNRRVFTFAGYVTSILGYRRPNEHKRNINREFKLRFPNIQLTLTKMRSLKQNLLSIALRMRMDLWIVAHAYVLFEKIILKQFVCKLNRKLCAGAALLISAKLNDVKGAMTAQLIQELETELRVSRKDLLHMELAVFIGLEFSVGASDEETQPHFRNLHKCLGLVSTFPSHSTPSRLSSIVCVTAGIPPTSSLVMSITPPT